MRIKLADCMEIQMTQKKAMDARSTQILKFKEKFSDSAAEMENQKRAIEREKDTAMKQRDIAREDLQASNDEKEAWKTITDQKLEEMRVQNENTVREAREEAESQMRDSFMVILNGTTETNSGQHKSKKGKAQVRRKGNSISIALV